MPRKEICSDGGFVSNSMAAASIVRMYLFGISFSGRMMSLSASTGVPSGRNNSSCSTNKGSVGKVGNVRTE